jgi:hypothetical protein
MTSTVENLKPFALIFKLYSVYITVLPFVQTRITYAARENEAESRHRSLVRGARPTNKAAAVFTIVPLAILLCLSAESRVPAERRDTELVKPYTMGY